MESESKLAEIDQITGEISKSLCRILELSLDTDEEVRYRALEALGQGGLADAVKRVRAAVHDSDELVRVASLELLGELEDTYSVGELERLICDESSLIRGAAALALGQIGGGNATDKLRSRLLLEEEEEVKIPICAALYNLGQEAYLPRLLGGLTSANYRVRCATANLLSSIANQSNKATLVEALSVAQRKETTAAALSSITNAISFINEESGRIEESTARVGWGELANPNTT